MPFAIKLCAAIFTFAGVVIGIIGTYLMTSAYHPFKAPAVIYNFFRVIGLLLRFQWKRAREMLSDAAFFGEINPEDRARSLLGIYVLGISFLFQTVGAALYIIDVFTSRSEAIKVILPPH